MDISIKHNYYYSWVTYLPITGDRILQEFCILQFFFCFIVNIPYILTGEILDLFQQGIICLESHFFVLREGLENDDQQVKQPDSYFDFIVHYE